MQKNQKSSHPKQTKKPKIKKSPVKKEYNIAYIDAQNLYLGTRAEGRQVDYNKFRIYLRDKFKVQEAYYFIGYNTENEQSLYDKLKKAGFTVVFREHSGQMTGRKKGNVDVDICFEMMKKSCDGSAFDHIVLVTGDGDYIKPVKYLIEQKQFKKILFPNKKYSSLYRQLQDRYSVNLSISDVKKKIIYIPAQETTEEKKTEIKQGTVNMPAIKPTPKQSMKPKSTESKPDKVRPSENKHKAKTTKSKKKQSHANKTKPRQQQTHQQKKKKEQ